jgi:hypothetical protein
MLDSGGKIRVKRTLRPLSGSAHTATIPERILALWLWGMTKRGHLVDSFQQPLLEEEGVDSSWGKKF